LWTNIVALYILRIIDARQPLRSLNPGSVIVSLVPTIQHDQRYVGSSVSNAKPNMGECTRLVQDAQLSSKHGRAHSYAGG